MPAEAFPRSALAPRGGQRGVTLVELIVALVVLGTLLPLVSMFVRNQIEGYLDVVRRAELVDIADGASRRMARDLQTALPNSVRTHGTACLEFIPTKAGGRYRAAEDNTAAGTPGDTLDFSAADASFDLFGSNPGIAVGDLVAVYNLGIPGAADAYDYAGSPASSTVTDVTAIEAGDLSGETKLRIGNKKFPLASPGNRFHVIPGTGQVVAYVCRVPAGGSGLRLYRHSYRLDEATGACPTVPDDAPILASDIVSCRFEVENGVLQRMGLVSISLEIARAGETIRLHRQVNVTNTP